MSSRISVLISIFLISLSCCRKKEAVVPISEVKYIYSFAFLYAKNSTVLKADVQGEILNDTIRFVLPMGTPVNSLTPAIQFFGRSMTPSSQGPLDYTNPVQYIVTADNGSTHVYTVIVRFVSGTKKITSFVLTAALNPGLSGDIKGVITGDTIILSVSSAVNLGYLTPTITHTGIAISPQSLAGQDFSSPVTYTVKAQDGSIETYTVITAVNSMVYAGSSDGYVYALYAALGTVKWKINTGNQISDPSYHNGSVFFGALNGAYYAVDAETGAVKWKFTKYSGAYTAAAVRDGIVYFGLVSYALRATYLYAVRESDGSLVFETLISDAPYILSLGNPAVAYGTIFITDSNTGLAEYDVQTGKKKTPFAYGLANLNPAIADSTAYVGIEGVLMIAVDVNTGKQRWVRVTAVPGWIESSLYPPNLYSSGTIVGNVIYVGSQHSMSALNRGDGTVKWYTPVNGFFASPVYGNGLVYAGNQDKRIYAFDAATGAVKWTFDNDQSNTEYIPNPTFANGIIYTHRAGNALYALDGLSGSLIWKFQALTGTINTNPCVIDGQGNVYYPGSSGEHN